MAPVGLWELVRYFLRLGSFGFGGPIALAGYMQRDLVSRKLVTEEEYAEGLAFAQMMPGPLAAQLAMWIGYIRHGVVGASLVGLVFVLPPFAIVIVVAMLYVAYDGLPVVQALFYGIGPAVIAIVALSSVRLATKTVARDIRMWIIFAVIAVITFLSRTEIALLFVLAGGIGILIYAPPWKQKPRPLALLLPVVGAGIAGSSTLARLAEFFIKAGAFTFGSGLAIVPFLHQGVVLENHWLSERQFLDAVAVGLITPGPVVITAAFIGYLVGGLPGAIAAGLGIFTPIYFGVVIPGRWFIRNREDRRVRAFVKGATAAAAGAIAGATVVLARGAIVDIPTAVIALASLAYLWRLKFRLKEPALVLATGIIGLGLHGI